MKQIAVLTLILTASMCKSTNHSQVVSDEQWSNPSFAENFIYPHCITIGLDVGACFNPPKHGDEKAALSVVYPTNRYLEVGGKGFVEVELNDVTKKYPVDVVANRGKNLLIFNGASCPTGIDGCIADPELFANATKVDAEGNYTWTRGEILWAVKLNFFDQDMNKLAIYNGYDSYTVTLNEVDDDGDD